MPQPVNKTTDWVAIQTNPVAGAGSQREQLALLVDSLRNLGLRPLVFKNRDRLSKTLQNPALLASLRCIVAAGGDGTVGDVINRYGVRKIAVLPLGTENLLARYLGIPRDGRAVAAMISQGKTRTIDLAAVGERRFAIMASLGFDADVVQRMAALRTGHIWRGSYLKPIWQSLRRYQYPRLRVWVDDRETPLSAKLVLVVNLNIYALGIEPARNACDNDGLLDLRLFERGSTFQMFRYFYKVFRGTHESLADVRSLRAGRIRVESDIPVAIQVDGDPAGETPVEIRVLPAACDVIVP